MGITNLAKRLAVMAVEKAVESGAMAIVSSSATKIGEALGARVAKKIHPPKKRGSR